MDELFGLRGKAALVVGGGRGMGRAAAELLARTGVAVAVLDVDRGRAEGAAASLADYGVATAAIAADVVRPEAADAAVGEARARLGRLDVLVNVVGMAEWAPLTELSDAGWSLDLDRNLGYVFRAGRAFARLPEEAPSGRAIVNIASIAGITAAVDHGAYGAAKAALMSLTRTMAVEWGSRGIRVNSIAPGTIETDGHHVPTDARVAREQAIPLRRIGRQDDIARVVFFLASDLSAYVTGQTLVVDGGILCCTPLPAVGRSEASG